jgi:hypothetical protein
MDHPDRKDLLNDLSQYLTQDDVSNGPDNFDISALVARLGLDDDMSLDESDGGSSQRYTPTSESESGFIAHLVQARQSAQQSTAESSSRRGSETTDSFQSADEGISDFEELSTMVTKISAGKGQVAPARAYFPPASAFTRSYPPQSTPLSISSSANSNGRQQPMSDVSSENGYETTMTQMSVQEFIEQSWAMAPTSSTQSFSSSPAPSQIDRVVKRTFDNSGPKRSRTISVSTTTSTSSHESLPYSNAPPVLTRRYTSSPALFRPNPATSYALDPIPPFDATTSADALSSPRQVSTGKEQRNRLRRSFGTSSKPGKASSMSNPPSPLRSEPESPPPIGTPLLRRSIQIQPTTAPPSPSASSSRRLSFIPPPSPSTRAARRFSAMFGMGNSSNSSSRKELARSIQVMPAQSFANQSASSWRSVWTPEEFEMLERDQGLSKVEIKRQEVIYELGVTETAFVEGQREVLRLFALPLRKPDGTFIAGVPVAFGFLLYWLDEIISLHEEISMMMMELRATSSNRIILNFAEAFQPFVRQLEVHQPYLVRFEAVTKSIDVMTEDSSSNFGEFLRRQSNLPELSGLPLASFLLKPLQRLMKLPLFFKVRSIISILFLSD